MDSTVVIATDHDLINEWIKGYAPNTARSYIRDIVFFYENVRRKLAAISSKDIDRYITELDVVSEAVRRRKLHAIKSLFRYGAEIGYLKSDPALAVRHIAREPEAAPPHALSEANVTDMLRNANERDYLIIGLAYYAALSSLEIAGLRWYDMMPKQKSLRITVPPHERYVPIADHLWKRLNQYRMSLDFVPAPMFASRLGGGDYFLSARQIGRIVHDVGARIGINANTSMLRNSHAQHALARGAALEAVQVIMRHRTTRTTVRHHTKHQEPPPIRSVDVLLKI